MKHIVPEKALIVVNKIDLLDASSFNIKVYPKIPSVQVSALTGKGIDTLVTQITQLADSFRPASQEDTIAINARHADALARSRTGLEAALEKLRTDGPVELLASDLRGTLEAFGEIIGKVDNERMLDQLFATFCIGK